MSSHSFAKPEIHPLIHRTDLLSASDISFINDSIRLREPFALVMLPGAESPLRWGGIPATSDCGDDIVISPWLKRYDESVRNLQGEDCGLSRLSFGGSTTYVEYISGVNNVIESCRRRNGKTVYSRVVCGSIPADSSWGEKASALFAEFQHTYRFIFYTPATGGWLGASPELLFRYDKNSSRFLSMALAGSRLSSLDGMPWDAKNIAEHKFVTDFITDTLSPYASGMTLSDARTLRYGPVEHMLHWISGNCKLKDVPAILDALSPTPALCGIPRDEAVADISRNERHRRGCYGGYICLELQEEIVAFVNLRSLQFEGRNFCLYGGGGITGDSVAEEEYEEASNKLSRILAIIN